MDNNQIWIDEIHKNSRYGLKGKILVKEKTDYQEIIIIETKEHGNAMMLDGCWMTSDNEEKYYHECLVHPALSSLKNISEILIIGGGDGGTVRECLKYEGITKIDLVEIDRKVIELSKKYLMRNSQNVWTNKKIKINISDGFQWIKGIKDNYYDAIFVDCSDPSGIANNLFSIEFYYECKRILKKEGIFATQSESPESFKNIHINIRNAIKNTFKQSATMYSFVPFYPSGIWSWTFAADNKKDFLKSRYKKIEFIERSCDIWSLNFQEGGFKMIPSKVLREIQ